jgi:hypothetical protein
LNGADETFDLSLFVSVLTCPAASVTCPAALPVSMAASRRMVVLSATSWVPQYLLSGAERVTSGLQVEVFP